MNKPKMSKRQKRDRIEEIKAWIRSIVSVKK